MMNVLLTVGVDAVGAVLSILIGETVTLFVLPALSTAVPVADRLLPSVLSVVGLEHELMPEVASLQVYVTTTFVLFQPLAFGAGDCVATIVGLVLSILTVAAVVAALPALSTTVPVTI